MDNSIIAEGRTTNEAIENGLKQLNTTREKVEIRVLEQEEKRSFFSILAPRVIKIQMTMKEEKKVKKEDKEIVINEQEVSKATERIKKVLVEFLKQLNIEGLKLDITTDRNIIKVSITGNHINYLIGYHGEVLNSLQSILNNIANKNTDQKCKVILDIEGYRAKREKALEELADKVAKTVIKNRKSITLEPMSAYERKIIHSRLQNDNKVKTHSIGEEPNRQVVIELK